MDQHLSRIGVSQFRNLRLCFSNQLYHVVIPKLLLASAYPAEKDPDAHKIRTREIVDAGVQVVVNTMEIEELKTFTPYQQTMLEHAKGCKTSVFIVRIISSVDCLANREIEFISFPIRDQSVHQDNQRVLEFCLELCERIKRGQVVLVHCWY